MFESKKEKLLPQARALAGEGVSKAVIAKSLQVAESTVRRWARQDAEQGRPWSRDSGPGAQRLARRRPAKPARLVRQLEERLAALAAQSEETETGAESAKLEERMLRICKVLEFLRAEPDDIGAQLGAMKRFAAFCLRTLCEDEMVPVRKAIRLFVDDLKREHS